MEAVINKKKELKKHLLRFMISGMTIALLFFALGQISSYAAPAVRLELGTANAGENTLGTIEILFTLVLIALAPTMLIMMTSFTRIIIVMSFLRNAMGTQQSPPNQIIIGLALFLTLFIMNPVLKEIETTAYKPYKAGEMTSQEALKEASKPIKTFMLKQVHKKDLNLFLTISGAALPEGSIETEPERLIDLGLEVIVPAFITSELKRAFTMGFLLFIPFLIIDMVVSSTLMSMGMVMLPPAMIALPFKIMVFVLVDGWGLLISTLVKSFR